jgi:hypothetical protein
MSTRGVCLTRRAALRKPHLPRRPCGLAPHRLEVRAVGPLRACHPWNTSRIFVPRRTRSEMSSGPSSVSCARKARWQPYRGIEAGVPSLRLAYRRPLTVLLAHVAAHASGTAVRPTEEPPLPANIAAGQRVSQPP